LGTWSGGGERKKGKEGNLGWGDPGLLLFHFKH